jgi:glycerol uptake facilitator-like aquaporin
MTPLRLRLAAEALGSFFLFTAVVGSGIMAARLSGGNDGVALLANAIATGAVLYVLIGMLGPVSGAHFNPAVSLVCAIRGDIGRTDLMLYIGIQIAFGILGVLAAHAMFDLPLLQASMRVRTGAGQWLSEGIATFGLVLTILGTLRHRPDTVPAAVALYITSAYWFTSSTSFANPAITIARALTDSFAGIAPADVPAFVVAQIAGALVALMTGRYLFSSQS